MKSEKERSADSRPVSDFDRLFQVKDGPQAPLDTEPRQRGKLNLDPDEVKNSLARLVLTLVKLLHELLERQAIRRMDDGTLREEDIERLGLALMKQSEELDRIRKEFGLEEDDLNLDLGPLGRLL